MRTKSNLAKVLGISTGHLSDLLSGRRSAGYPLAKKISYEIGSPPEIWLRGGGDSEARRAVIDVWRKNMAPSGSASWYAEPATEAPPPG